MRIAVIGTGNVGSALGTRWAKNGHRVIFATRDPGSNRIKVLLNAAGTNASAARIAEAVAGAEVVVLATP